MRFDYLPEDLKSVWQELDTNPAPIPLDELRKETEKLRKGLSRRSVAGGVACLIVIASWALFFFVFPNLLQRIGSILTVMGTAYMAVQLRMRRALAMPEPGEIDCVRFYRTELERQRDFHRGKWFWSRMLIFTPGPIVFCIGFAQAHPKIATGIHLELVALVILAIVAVPLNLRLARKYQRRIDALDRLQKDG